MKKTNLQVVGKGGSADVVLPSEHRYGRVPVHLIKPNPFQPRKIFDEEGLETLSETIAENGDVEEDVRLADNGDGTFTLINGERRLRATKKAGKSHISAKICKTSRSDLLVKACLANFCVEDMTLVEKAFAFRALMTENGWSQSELARKIGKGQGTISNALKIFNLHENIQSLALYNKIDPGIALRLASFEKEDQGLLMEFCREEIQKRKKPFAPNEILIFIRKKADENEIVPRKNKKRSRVSLPHYDLIARSVGRSMDRFAEGLESLSELTPDSLLRMKEPDLSKIIVGLEDLEDLILKHRNKLEEIKQDASQKLLSETG